MTVKPITHAEIIRKLLVRSHTRPTVTLKTTAKGEVQVEVTVPETTVEKAGLRAQAEFDRLRAAYPQPNGDNNLEAKLAESVKRMRS